jgi:hypothetical protein
MAPQYFKDQMDAINLGACTISATAVRPAN